MKKIVLTLVALLSLTAVNAQSENQEKKAPREMKAPKEMTPQERTARMAQRLGLNDTQKSQLEALNTEYADVLKAPGRHHGLGMHNGPRQKPQTDGETGATTQQQRPERPQLTDAQKAEMKQMFEKRQAYESKLKEILTADQYKEYQKMQPRRGHGHGGPRPEKPAAKTE